MRASATNETTESGTGTSNVAATKLSRAPSGALAHSALVELELERSSADANRFVDLACGFQEQ